MKNTVIALVAMICAFSVNAASVEPERLTGELEQIRIKARAGDYAAQRNLAYTYATGGFELAGTKYPVAACAWYLALPHFNRAKTAVGDAGNVKVYCGSLELDKLQASLQYASDLVAKYGATKR